MVAESLARQKFLKVSEDAIIQQIQMYQMAQQTYLAASAFFDKADVALPVSFFSFFFFFFLVR
jgi:ferritin heavy chain